MKKIFIGIIIFFALLVGGLVVYQINLGSGICTENTQPAKNRITGRVKTFGTPCEVPFWYVALPFGTVVR
ncbi:MAG: hypothetical protein HYT94_00725 [Parcubacteria group bacterium]|nr:hypothetical protein [Parcubacteria group bacterium]